MLLLIVKKKIRNIMLGWAVAKPWSQISWKLVDWWWKGDSTWALFSESILFLMLFIFKKCIMCCISHQLYFFIISNTLLHVEWKQHMILTRIYFVLHWSSCKSGWSGWMQQLQSQAQKDWNAIVAEVASDTAAAACSSHAVWLQYYDHTLMSLN